MSYFKILYKYVWRLCIVSAVDFCLLNSFTKSRIEKERERKKHRLHTIRCKRKRNNFNFVNYFFCERAHIATVVTVFLVCKQKRSKLIFFANDSHLDSVRFFIFIFIFWTKASRFCNNLFKIQLELYKYTTHNMLQYGTMVNSIYIKNASGRRILVK